METYKSFEDMPKELQFRFKKGQELGEKFENIKNTIAIDCGRLEWEFNDLENRFDDSPIEYIKQYRRKLKDIISIWGDWSYDILNYQQFAEFIESKTKVLENMFVEGDKIKIFDSTEEKETYLKKLLTPRTNVIEIIPVK